MSAKGKPCKEGGQFKFTVCPGNNSRALLTIFRTRPWFNTVSHKDDTKEPDLLWEMYRNPARYLGKKAEDSPSSSPSKSSQGVQADTCCLNHFERDSVLVTKHGLYWSMRALCEDRREPMPDYLPETYHVVPDEGAKNDSQAAEWGRFATAFERHQAETCTLPPITKTRAKEATDEAAGEAGMLSKAKSRRKKGEDATNVWIAKPAALSNRGMGAFH